MKVSKPVLQQAPCVSYVNCFVGDLGETQCPYLKLSFSSNVVPAAEGHLNPQAAPDPSTPQPMDISHSKGAHILPHR